MADYLRLHAGDARVLTDCPSVSALFRLVLQAKNLNVRREIRHIAEKDLTGCAAYKGDFKGMPLEVTESWQRKTEQVVLILTGKSVRGFGNRRNGLPVQRARYKARSSVRECVMREPTSGIACEDPGKMNLSGDGYVIVPDQEGNPVPDRESTAQRAVPVE